MSAIVVSRVHKSYRRGPETVQALRGIDLELTAGEVVALIGPSGSGKTTLLNILCGWERPDTGAVTGAGDVPWSALGILPQRHGLVEELTVADNVELPLRLAGWGAPKRARRRTELLTALEVDHLTARYPVEASLGEQQRVALARALVLAPRVVLADEPTSHQDARREAMIFDLLRIHAAGGALCVVATHDPRSDQLCHRTVRLADGKVVGDERHPGVAEALTRRLWGPPEQRR